MVNLKMIIDMLSGLGSGILALVFIVVVSIAEFNCIEGDNKKKEEYKDDKIKGSDKT